MHQPNRYLFDVGTPEDHRLAHVDAKSETNLWDWDNVEVTCMCSFIQTKSPIDSIMLIILDKIFIHSDLLQKKFNERENIKLWKQKYKTISGP